MKTLSISPTLELPLDVLAERTSIIAKNGVGKSTTACAIVEGALDNAIQCVVLDPKGDWWGLKSSADGKSAGYPVHVFGGDHADIPIQVEAGRILGAYLAGNNVSAVVDLSDFSKSKMVRFAADFLEALYETKKRAAMTDRRPLFLVNEEADELAPQKIPSYAGPDLARCLGAMERIAKRGRFLGLGLLNVTQRCASLNKDVLTQSDNMIFMRTTSPQDRKAADDWLKGQDEVKRQEVQDAMPGLPTGEGYVWCPQRGVFQRVAFRRRRTFDAGFTPRIGQARVEPKVLAKVDLEALRGEMAALVEKAKADDPALLRARIRELEKQAAAKLVAAPARVAEKPVEVPVLADGVKEDLHGLAAYVREQADRIVKEVAPILKRIDALPRRGQGAPPQKVAPRPVAPPSSNGHALKPVKHEAAGELEQAQQRILDTVAMLDSRGITADVESVARWLGLHPNGGRYRANVNALRSAGLMEDFTLTPQGVAAARNGYKTGLAGVSAAVDDDGKRNIIVALREAEAESVEELAARLDLHPNGGRFRGNLNWLRTMGVVTRGSRVALTEAAHR